MTYGVECLDPLFYVEVFILPVHYRVMTKFSCTVLLKERRGRGGVGVGEGGRGYRRT